MKEAEEEAGRYVKKAEEEIERYLEELRRSKKSERYLEEAGEAANEYLAEVEEQAERYVEEAERYLEEAEEEDAERAKRDVKANFPRLQWPRPPRPHPFGRTPEGLPEGPLALEGPPDGHNMPPRWPQDGSKSLDHTPYTLCLRPYYALDP